MKLFFAIAGLQLIFFSLSAQIPDVYSEIQQSPSQGLIINTSNHVFTEKKGTPEYTLKQLMGNPQGTASGLSFNFEKAGFSGTLVYGFINFNDAAYPLPVYFKTTKKIEDGKCEINLKDDLSGKYDMIGWEKTGRGTLGYRVIDKDGKILYDGMINFKGIGPFEIATTIVSGPFVNCVTDTSVIISLDLNISSKVDILINGNEKFESKEAAFHHEILISRLHPDSEYFYTVFYGNSEQTYSFKTAPEKGSDRKIVFAYASDGRSGNGGGERSFLGTNMYIIRKIVAFASYQQSDFFLFTGDLISGYTAHPESANLQYTNFKRSIEPFAHYFPVYTTIGNHEAVLREFENEGRTVKIQSDRFPFTTESAEAVFAGNFVNFKNGPIAEKVLQTDKTALKKEFPPYSETVYSFVYGNSAFIVLNSNYFYSPSLSQGMEGVSGNIHGYVMDEQLKFLESQLKLFEADTAIDHVFITIHTPFFPNGGHIGDDMWYSGSNSVRPVVDGKSAKFGIIERRDQLMDLIVNKNAKVRAVLTGDEHNYSRLEIPAGNNFYPENYPNQKLVLSRPFLQINNGAAGAPYYARESTPWQKYLKIFSTQNAVAIFTIEGKVVKMVVYNPDTLNIIDEFILNQ